MNAQQAETRKKVAAYFNVIYHSSGGQSGKVIFIILVYLVQFKKHHDLHCEWDCNDSFQSNFPTKLSLELWTHDSLLINNIYLSFIYKYASYYAQLNVREDIYIAHQSSESSLSLFICDCICVYINPHTFQLKVQIFVFSRVQHCDSHNKVVTAITFYVICVGKLSLC